MGYYNIKLVRWVNDNNHPLHGYLKQKTVKVFANDEKAAEKNALFDNPNYVTEDDYFKAKKKLQGIIEKKKTSKKSKEEIKED